MMRVCCSACDCGEHDGNCHATGPFAAALNSQCKNYPGEAPKKSRCSCQPCAPQDNATDANCSTMADTLLLLDKRIREDLGLNFSSFLIDSFWYGENINQGGVWKWEDTPDLVADLFPDGLAALHKQLLAQRGGAPLFFKAHNGQWRDSPYRSDPRFAPTNYCEGGCEGESGAWLPQGPALWRHLFDTEWGLTEIKQDHARTPPSARPPSSSEMLTVLVAADR